MKQLLRLALPVLLLSTACNKDPETVVPKPDPTVKISAHLSHPRYGLEQLDDSVDSIRLTSIYMLYSFQFELTGANGMKNGEEPIIFRFTTDLNGKASLPLSNKDLRRYKDGKLYLRLDLHADNNYTTVDSVVKEEYKIRTYADLANIGYSVKDSYPDEPFVQMQDISCPDNFTNTNNVFSGIYDGQNYKITNFNQPVTTDWIGLFGKLQPRSVVKNVRLETSSIRSTNLSCYGGGIAAMADSAVIMNCSVKGNITADTTSGATYIGGIVGKAINTTITACSQSGDLTGAVTGGIISVGNNDTVKTCYKTGGIYTNFTAGGIMAMGIDGANVSVYDSYVYLTVLRAPSYYALYQKGDTNGTISRYFTNADNINTVTGNTGYTLYTTVAELNNHLAAIPAYKANTDKSLPLILWWQ